jgi:hypothetical protein
LDRAIEGNSGQLKGNEIVSSSAKKYGGFLAKTVRRGEQPLFHGNLTFNFLILTLLI